MFLTRTFATFVALVLVSFGDIHANAHHFSGIWYDPAQGGTGFSIEQNASTIFIVWYSYTDGSQPYWVAATAVAPSGSNTYTGQVFAYSATGFGPNFKPSTIKGQAVGTVTATISSMTSATLSYTVNGRTGNYSLQPYTAAAEDVSGSYLGGQILDTNGCGRNPTQSATFNISQTKGTIQLRISYPADYCTATGSYTQMGSRIAISNASLNCSSGVAGTFSSAQIVIGYRTFTLPFSANITSPTKCAIAGVINGMR